MIGVMLELFLEQGEEPVIGADESLPVCRHDPAEIARHLAL
jgi:hypothetical protein